MDTLEAIAFLGTLLLFCVAYLSGLSAFSKTPVQNARTEEARRLWEGSWLIVLVFLSTLAILVWRVW